MSSTRNTKPNNAVADIPRLVKAKIAINPTLNINEEIIKHEIDNYVTHRHRVYGSKRIMALKPKLRKDHPILNVTEEFDRVRLDLFLLTVNITDFASLEKIATEITSRHPNANLMPMLDAISIKLFKQPLSIPIPKKPLPPTKSLHEKISVLEHHGKRMLLSQKPSDKVYGYFTYDLACSISTLTHELFDNQNLSNDRKKELKRQLNDLLTDYDMVNNAHRAKAAKLVSDIFKGLGLTLFTFGIGAGIYYGVTKKNPLAFFNKHPTLRKSEVDDIKQEYSRIVASA